MTETKNLKLKTYETTTDSQELVARYIDDTSDNFQRIDEFCKTDTTLSVEGGIADAKTVGDNVSQLKEDLVDLDEFLFSLFILPSFIAQLIIEYEALSLTELDGL